MATAAEDMEAYSRAVAFADTPSDPDLGNNLDDTLIQVGDVADLDLQVTSSITTPLLSKMVGSDLKFEQSYFPCYTTDHDFTTHYSPTHGQLVTIAH